MKNPLSKTELSGLILLAILVTVITGGAIWLKGCRGEGMPPVPQAVVTVVDSTSSEAAADSLTSRKGERKHRQKKSRKKKSPASRKSDKKSANRRVERHDPFADTIPSY